MKCALKKHDFWLQRLLHNLKKTLTGLSLSQFKYFFKCSYFKFRAQSYEPAHSFKRAEQARCKPRVYYDSFMVIVALEFDLTWPYWWGESVGSWDFACLYLFPDLCICTLIFTSLVAECLYDIVMKWRLIFRYFLIYSKENTTKLKNTKPTSYVSNETLSFMLHIKRNIWFTKKYLKINVGWIISQIFLLIITTIRNYLIIFLTT